MKRLFVDLTPQEEADIAGWVNYYNDHPAETPTRIVLSDRSRTRFDQIAQQFGSSIPQPPSVADPNWGCPPGTFKTIIVDNPMYREDKAREQTLNISSVLAVPLVIPPEPYTKTLILSMGCAEYGPAGRPMQGCFSRLAGDFGDSKLPLTLSGGTSVFSLININTAHLDPGATVYFNVRLWSPDNMTTGPDVPHHVRIAGNWPQ